MDLNGARRELFSANVDIVRQQHYGTLAHGQHLVQLLHLLLYLEVIQGKAESDQRRGLAQDQFFQPTEFRTIVVWNYH